MTDLKVMKWPGKFRPASPLSAGIRGGDILWLAGQVPTDPDTGEAVMAGGIEAQTEKVFVAALANPAYRIETDAIAIASRGSATHD